MSDFHIALAFFALGGVGLIAAIILVKMGYGKPVIGALTKASRMAIKAVRISTRR
jgi:hypothetical protein